jgi:hypothetical protein
MTDMEMKYKVTYSPKMPDSFDVLACFAICDGISFLSSSYIQQKQLNFMSLGLLMQIKFTPILSS